MLQSGAMDEKDFRRHADAAMESLKQSLIDAEGDADFEVEDQSGALHIGFEEPPARFVVSPNAPARQIWISALSTSFKLDWNDDQNDFVLAKTGEGLKPLVSRLMNQQLESEVIDLD
jgi:iron donor protein CyaY